ncbi:MAG: TetR/AcrR family transcriptional regulator [Clostridiales bacterium]
MMQIKKEEIKEAILNAGEDEFFEKGYDKASIRSIVMRAHTTIGNFYNYYNSKEALYNELVYDIYHQMSHLIKHHKSLESIDQLKELEELRIDDSKDSIKDIEKILMESSNKSKTKKRYKKKVLWIPKNLKLWRFILKQLVKKYFPPIDRRFVMLMTATDTTPYAHARTDLAQILEEHFIKHIEDYAPNYAHKELGSIVANQVIEGLIQIGRQNLPTSKAQELTIEQFLFITIGTIGILQGGLPNGK